MQLQRPVGVFHLSVRLGVDEIVRRNRQVVLTEHLSEVILLLRFTPRVAEREHARPPIAHALGRRRLPRVVVRAAGHVGARVHDRQRQVLGCEIECRQRGAVIGVSRDAVRTRIRDRRRDVEGRERPVRVELHGELPLSAPDAAGAHAEVRHDLALEPERHFLRVGILQVGRERDAGKAAARAVQTSFLAALVDEIAVEVVPDIPAVPRFRIRVDVFAERRPRIPPVLAVVRLQDGSAVRRQRQAHADARRDEIPGVEIVDGVKDDVAGGELTGGVFLLGEEVAIVVVADAEVQGHAIAEPPGVLGVQSRPCRGRSRTSPPRRASLPTPRRCAECGARRCRTPGAFAVWRFRGTTRRRS